jgi:HEAT repeat protein
VVYDEQDRWMRLFAIEALGRIGDLRAIEALMDAAYDESRDLRTKAIVTLGELDYTLALDSLDWLAHDPDLDGEDQQTALFELGKRRDIRALDGLVDLLREDPRADTRMYAALVLGDLGTWEAVGPLILALCDDMPDVAGQVIKSLVKMGDTAVEPLVNMLTERSSAEQRLWAVRVLGDIGGARALAALNEVALNTAEQWWVREEARGILKRQGHDPQRPG